ncbi:hypothetical protein BgiBS90_033590, partial [Biomphalaria glabrata]
GKKLYYRFACPNCHLYIGRVKDFISFLQHSSVESISRISKYLVTCCLSLNFD